MSDLRAQLQSSLGTGFIIERELGGGGMSRVFVANEVRLARKVAIKVLSPELAQGLSAERFEREILLAASLQQANIVPILAAGEVDGLPYFTMPFIEGESLRHRIGARGMPMDEVLTVLRDVTRALAFAHSRGIVHRDIKPDNVLLSGGTAVVTDFGIAKALAESKRPDQSAGAALTQLGTSIGTPEYMAPEQVAGDPDIDARADLYALGCVAQEMLTGKSPFAGRPPQKMLAAHLSEAPPSITAVRNDVPPSLTALITALLQKDPAHRPASADDVLKSLNVMSTTSASTIVLDAPGMLPRIVGLYVVATAIVLIVAKAAIIGIGLPAWVFSGALIIMIAGLPAMLLNRHRTVGSMARVGAVVLAVFVLMIGGYMGLRAAGIGPWGSLVANGSMSEGAHIVLADFVAEAKDSALAKVVGEAVRAAMSQSTSARVVEKSDVARVLELMKQNTGARLGDNIVGAVATRLGAAAILKGQLAPAGNGYAVSIELVRAKDGAQLASFQATSDGTKDLLPLVDELTQKLRGRLGESLKEVQNAVPLERATTASLEALQLYSEGSYANDVTYDYKKAIQLLRQAVTVDSTFAMAWRKLATATRNSVNFESSAADSAFERAKEYAARLPALERNLILGAYYQNHSTQNNRAEALAAYQAAYRADSNSVIANNQLTRIFYDRRQFDSALHYRRRKFAIQQDPSSAAQLARALMDVGQTTEAERMIDSLERADSNVRQLPSWTETSLDLLAAKGDLDSLDARLGRMAAASSENDRVAPTVTQRIIARQQAQMKRVGELGARLRGLGAVAAFETEDILSRLYYLGDDEATVRALDQLITKDPVWRKLHPTTQGWDNIAVTYALAGRGGEARQAMKSFNGAMPKNLPEFLKLRELELEGFLALAEKRYPEALQKFREASVSKDDQMSYGCQTCAYWNLGLTFDRAGQADSAIVMFEKIVATPRHQLLDDQPLAIVHKRLGELYQAKGENAKALEQYRAFVKLWEKADAEFQPVVSEVKKRVTELEKRRG